MEEGHGSSAAPPPARPAIRRGPIHARLPHATPPPPPLFPSATTQSTDFDRTGSLLSGTLQRLDGLLRQGRQGHMCYMIFFALTVFLLLWFVMSKR